MGHWGRRRSSDRSLEHAHLDGVGELLRLGVALGDVDHLLDRLAHGAADLGGLLNRGASRDGHGVLAGLLDRLGDLAGASAGLIDHLAHVHGVLTGFRDLLVNATRALTGLGGVLANLNRHGLVHAAANHNGVRARNLLVHGVAGRADAAGTRITTGGWNLTSHALHRGHGLRFAHGASDRTAFRHHVRDAHVVRERHLLGDGAIRRAATSLRLHVSDANRVVVRLIDPHLLAVIRGALFLTAAAFHDRVVHGFFDLARHHFGALALHNAGLLDHASAGANFVLVGWLAATGLAAIAGASAAIA